MKLHIERKDGALRIMQRIDARLEPGRNHLRTIRVIEDTPANYQDILRWMDVVGHTLEEA